MPIFTLNFQTYAPDWQPGHPIDGWRIQSALQGLPIKVRSVDPNSQTGVITIESDVDPAPLVAGLTFGPSADELARQTIVNNYKAAVVTLRGLTPTSGVAAILSAVQTLERRTTAVLKQLDRDIDNAL